MSKNILGVVLAVIACSGVRAESLPLWNTSDIAAFAAYANELASNKDNRSDPYYVRIYTFPLTLGECWGSIDSCPNEELAISISSGDLYENPIVLRLPPSKGWEFVQWIGIRTTADQKTLVGFVLRTTLPDANIEQAQRTKFKSKQYEVWVSDTGGNYVVR
jgi:hypothetical protein